MRGKRPEQQQAESKRTASAEALPPTIEFDERLFISPRNLASRWQCSRSQADRIARRAGFARYCFGRGRNGMVRYLKADVEALEQAQRT